MLLSFCGTLALTFAAATGQAQPLVGTWSTTVNWNLPSGIMITSSFTPDGHLQSTTQNRMGQSFMLSGSYQFDTGQGVLRYQWQDYAPKQACVGADGSGDDEQYPLPQRQPVRRQFVRWFHHLRAHRRCGLPDPVIAAGPFLRSLLDVRFRRILAIGACARLRLLCDLERSFAVAVVAGQSCPTPTLLAAGP
jgi:hypothetical protein